LEALKKDPVITGALGEHALHNFLLDKQGEWECYTRAVTDWEIKNYLEKY
jgi:glutamine synthetase